MSYEGYEQCLCKNGHLSSFDAYDCFDKDNMFCSNCGAPIVWSNMVDQTNGEECGYIDMEALKITDTVHSICETCKQSRFVSPSIYRIPTEEETNNSRTVNYGDGVVFIKDL